MRVKRSGTGNTVAWCGRPVDAHARPAKVAWEGETGIGGATTSSDGLEGFREIQRMAVFGRGCLQRGDIYVIGGQTDLG